MSTFFDQLPHDYKIFYLKPSLIKYVDECEWLLHNISYHTIVDASQNQHFKPQFKSVNGTVDKACIVVFICLFPSSKILLIQN